MKRGRRVARQSGPRRCCHNAATKLTTNGWCERRASAPVSTGRPCHWGARLNSASASSDGRTPQMASQRRIGHRVDVAAAQILCLDPKLLEQASGKGGAAAIQRSTVAAVDSASQCDGSVPKMCSRAISRQVASACAAGAWRTRATLADVGCRAQHLRPVDQQARQQLDDGLAPHVRTALVPPVRSR